MGLPEERKKGMRTKLQKFSDNLFFASVGIIFVLMHLEIIGIDLLGLFK